MSRSHFRRIQALFRRKSKKFGSQTTSEFCFPQTTERDYHCLSPYDISRVLSEGYDLICEEKKLQYLHNHRRYCIENTAPGWNDISAPASFTLFPLLLADKTYFHNEIIYTSREHLWWPPRVLGKPQAHKGVELRIQIWTEAASFPHFVELCCIPEHPRNRWLSHRGPPAMLDYGWKARAVVDKHFSKLEFSLPESLPYDDNEQLPPLDPIYFNFSTSTLCLSADVKASYAQYLLENNIQLKTQLRRLLVDEEVWIALDGGREAIAWKEMKFMLKRGRSGAVGSKLKALEDVQFHVPVREAN